MLISKRDLSVEASRSRAFLIFRVYRYSVMVTDIFCQMLLQIGYDILNALTVLFPHNQIPDPCGIIQYHVVLQILNLIRIEMLFTVLYIAVA